MVEFPECLSCGTQCCKGTAVRLFPHELNAIAEKHPEIHNHVDTLDLNYHLFTFPDGCPFLNSDNKCGLRLEGILPPLGCQFGPFYINCELTTNNSVMLMPARNNTCPSAASIPYSVDFRNLFHEIVGYLQTYNPDITIVTNEEFLLKNNFW